MFVLAPVFQEEGPELPTTLSIALGPSLHTEYWITDEFSISASYGAGPYQLITADPSSNEGNGVEIDYGLEDALSAGATYWFSEGWGVDFKTLIGSGDTTFTIGLGRRFFRTPKN